MNYVWLTLLTLFAIDWFFRIMAYYRTGNEKYKHAIFWWHEKSKKGGYYGNHIKSGTR